MKHSVFTVVAKEFGTVRQTAEKVRELGYDGIEWRIHPDYHIAPDKVEEVAQEVGAICRALNLEIPCLCTYLLSHEKALIEKVMRGAGAMGCPAIRVRDPHYTGNENIHGLIERTLAELADVEKLSRRHKVKALLETHMGRIGASPAVTYELVRRFDPACIGAILDPGNMVVEGMMHWKMAMELLGPYLCSVHVKNAGWTKGADGKWSYAFMRLEEGAVDWKVVINYLKEIGYTGYLTNENFADVPASAKLASDLAYMKSLL